MNAPLLSRRAFIAAGVTAAGGLFVAVAARASGIPLSPAPWADEGAPAPSEVDAFVVVEPDETILLRIAKSEMGQGVMTSLAMIVAEELECDFAKVKVEYASANRNYLDGGPYGQMGTGGSSSVRRSR
jgi:isoquinoline 1-oxidoreductase subunit beta